jgi:multidrug efflux pump subunit AcrB
MSIFISLFTIFGFVIWYLDYTKEDPITKEKKEGWWILVLLGIIILMIWIFIPIFFQFLGTRNFQTAKIQIKQLENHGYTHQEALSKIQSLYENMKKNQAMRDSAMIIGDSISNNNNNSYRQPFY